MLQAFCALLQANPVVGANWVLTYFSFGALDPPSTWRLVVRIEVILYAWCWSLYISNLYRSLKPRAKVMGFYVLEIIFNIVHILCLGWTYYLLEWYYQQGEVDIGFAEIS